MLTAIIIGAAVPKFFSIFALIAGFAMMLGVITIADPDHVKPTTTPVRLPGVSKDSNTNPRPVRVASTGTTGSGTVLVERTKGENLNRGYLGYSLTLAVDAAANAEENAVSVVHGCIIDGFSGVTPQMPVFVDATAVPVPEGTFSGLTHVDPADGTLAVGVGVTATKIYFYAPQQGTATP